MTISNRIRKRDARTKNGSGLALHVQPENTLVNIISRHFRLLTDPEIFVLGNWNGEKLIYRLLLVALLLILWVNLIDDWMQDVVVEILSEIVSSNFVNQNEQKNMDVTNIF